MTSRIPYPAIPTLSDDITTAEELHHGERNKLHVLFSLVRNRTTAASDVKSSYRQADMQRITDRQLIKQKRDVGTFLTFVLRADCSSVRMTTERIEKEIFHK
ncbi:Hypothetical protein NTJ_09706 [Nesidiocoris tenuis]|uniref:Uncharacterized protein n=1 Tax=Nesidiocoris tenuis TaxID=355587 RepID=A0ABN7AY49_9HEMI|nr:Hypothetical protein NTJ_09706 [Nesidiocoris tenuis]